MRAGSQTTGCHGQGWRLRAPCQRVGLNMNTNATVRSARHPSELAVFTGTNHGLTGCRCPFSGLNMDISATRCAREIGMGVDTHLWSWCNTRPGSEPNLPCVLGRNRNNLPRSVNLIALQGLDQKKSAQNTPTLVWWLKV